MVNLMQSKKQSVFRFLLGIKKALCFFILFVMTHSITADAQQLQFKYLGAAGWIITQDSLTILIDPYITRHKLGNHPSNSDADPRESMSGKDVYFSDTVMIDSIIKEADYILVHHSHMDHLGDVPYIARKTGAVVIGTETTSNILRAYGIPDQKLITVEGGEDYQFDDFSVRVVRSLHSALGDKRYFDSSVHADSEKLKPPLRLEEFVEGGSLMFLVRFDRHKVLTAGSMNFIEKEVEGLKPDILLPGVNFSRLEIYKYTERLLTLTNYPKIVIPTHWDNFRVPYGYSQETAIERKIKPFIEEVKAASPVSKVIVPVHLETFTIE